MKLAGVGPGDCCWVNVPLGSYCAASQNVAMMRLKKTVQFAKRIKVHLVVQISSI